MSKIIEEFARTHLSVQQTVSVVEQALREVGAVGASGRSSWRSLTGEITQVLARTGIPWLPMGDQISVRVEPLARDESRLVIVSRPRAFSRSSAVGKREETIRRLLQVVKRSEEEMFPEGWSAFGEVQIDSGTLLLADLMCGCDPVKIAGIPPARYPVYGQTSRIPEVGQQMMRIRLMIRPGSIDARKPLGIINIDPQRGPTAVIVGDERLFEEHLKAAASRRMGHTRSRKIAALIEQQFGLTPKALFCGDPGFEEPISEDLEARITAYVKSLPEYDPETHSDFWVEPNYFSHRVEEILNSLVYRSSSSVPLDQSPGASLLAFNSDFFMCMWKSQVVGLCGAGELRGIEVIV